MRYLKETMQYSIPLISPININKIIKSHKNEIIVGQYVLYNVITLTDSV